MKEISTPFFNLRIDPIKGSFDIVPRDNSYPAVLGARTRVIFGIDGKKVSDFPLEWRETSLDSTDLSKQSGSFKMLGFQTELFGGQIGCKIQFASSEQLPLLLWRIQIENLSDFPRQVEQIDLLRAGGSLINGAVEFPGKKLAFYKNGWQSWSHSGTYLAGQSMLNSKLGMFQNPMVINAGTPSIRRPDYFSSDFFGAISSLETRMGLLLGFLSQKQHFGTVEVLLDTPPSLNLWANGDASLLEPGCTQRTDWAVISTFSLDDPDPLHVYLKAAARENDVHLPVKVPVGWCSWYQYYTHIDAEIIRKNLSCLKENVHQLPLNLVQIDDGFEAQVGDWLDFKPGFPEGVAPLAREIHAAGLTPGLWLAPFIVHPKARLIQENPDLLLRSSRGKPVNAGFGWNTFTQALDLTNPKALEYAQNVVATAVHTWGFSYLKLDFLYAAALPGRYQDPTRTRAQVMRDGMQALRDAAGPETFLVGCGAPLGSVLGLVQANRIGADVSGSWRPKFSGISFPFHNEPHMPCARNSIQNILTRNHLHNQWWINDPDCLLIRPDSDLTLDEVKSLATVIGMTGGSFLLSDDLTALPPERMEIAKAFMPSINQKATVIDLFERLTPTHLRSDFEQAIGKWSILAYFNWSDSPLSWKLQGSDFHLPPGVYRGSSFWEKTQFIFDSAQPFDMSPIPPHGVALLAVYPHPVEGPTYAGSSIHFSQGKEISSWIANTEKVFFTVSIDRSATADIVLWLPAAPTYAAANGQAITWQFVGDGFYNFSVNIADQAQIEIHWTE